MQTFRLIPYPASDLPKIDIVGEIKRVENQISIYYQVSGEVDQIAFPVPSSLPSRKDDLWKATCFEFFLAVPNQPQYWEFNMSPSGDWNVYLMDEYRRVGFREETAIAELRFKFEIHESKTTLESSIDLNPLFPASQCLQVGITAIIQAKDGYETYWALAHPGPQADFHMRKSLTIEV